MATMSWDEYQKQFPAPHDLQAYTQAGNEQFKDIQYDQRPQEWKDEYDRMRRANMEWQADYYNKGYGSTSGAEVLLNPFVQPSGRPLYGSDGKVEYIGSPPPAVDWEAEAAAGRPVIGPAVPAGGGSRRRRTTTGAVGGSVAPPPPPPPTTTPSSPVIGPGPAGGTGTTPFTGGSSTSSGGGGTAPAPQPERVGPAAFNVGSGSVSIAQTNPDGTIKWTFWDGSKNTFETLTKEQFAAKYGSQLADSYYSNEIPVRGQYPVQQFNSDNFLSEGNNFRILKRNADGTIEWGTGDGTPFSTMSKQDFARYWGRDAAERYYGTTAQPPLPGANPLTPGGMTDPRWKGVMSSQVNWPSVTNLPADQLKSVAEQEYFARYPDVYEAYRRDPQGKTAEEFARWHWETYGKAEGRDMPYSTNMPENPTTVGAGTWFQNGPEGDQFKVINRNADGTITWQRSDGALFQNIDAETFEKYFPGQSGRFYTMERTVDPAKETVAGQLDALLKGDSTYLQRARAAAMQTANARGLINSSIAGGAGVGAAIDRAMPIAQADANIYGQAKQYNVELANTRAGEALNRTFQRQMQEDAQAWQSGENQVARQFNMDEAEKNRVWQATQTETQRAWQTIQNSLDREQQLKLQNASTSQTGQNAVANLVGNYQNAIAVILADPEISNNPADGQNGVSPKQALINKQYELFRQNLIAVGKIYGVPVNDLYPELTTQIARPPVNDSGTPSTSTGPDGTKTGGVVNYAFVGGEDGGGGM